MELETTYSMRNCTKDTINHQSAQFCSKSQKQKKFKQEEDVEPALIKHVKQVFTDEENSFIQSPEYRSRKNSLRSDCNFCSQIPCYCSEDETDDTSSDNQSNMVAFSDDAQSQTSEIPDMLWDQSSICTEQSNGKQQKVIRYLHINPLVPEEEKFNTESTDDSYDSMVQIFEQISESKRSASKILAGCCFDCERSHRCSCQAICWNRLSLVGLSYNYAEMLGLSKNILVKKPRGERKSRQCGSDRSIGGVDRNEVQKPQGLQSIVMPQIISSQASDSILLESGNLSSPPIQEILKQIEKPPEVTQQQLLSFSFHLLEHRVNEAAHQRAKNFLKKLNSQDNNYYAMLQMVQEVYRILLLPDEPLRLYVQTLSPAKKMSQMRSSLNKLRTQYNRHPLAQKALQKLKAFFQDQD